MIIDNNTIIESDDDAAKVLNTFFSNIVRYLNK